MPDNNFQDMAEAAGFDPRHDTSEKDLFQRMADNWEGEIIARTEVKRFTGGMLSPGYIANLDAKGEGPPGKIKFKGRIGYDKTLFVQWMRNRSAIAMTPRAPSEVTR